MIVGSPLPPKSRMWQRLAHLHYYTNSFCNHEVCMTLNSLWPAAVPPLWAEALHDSTFLCGNTNISCLIFSYSSLHEFNLLLELQLQSPSCLPTSQGLHASGYSMLYAQAWSSTQAVWGSACPQMGPGAASGCRGSHYYAWACKLFCSVFANRWVTTQQPCVSLP